MSIRFSRVTTMANNQAYVFLVGGKPVSQEDLNGWTAFEEQASSLKANEVVVAHVETFLYGEGDPVDATPEEVAYMYQRINMRSDFIETRTEKCGEDDIVLWLNK